MQISLPPEMIVAYRERRKEDLRVLEKALEEKNIEPFHRIGHQWSGNARSYGFPELETIGLEMEAMSPAELPTSGKRFVQELSHWLAS